MKTCRACLVEFPNSHFAVDGRTRDGLSTVCMPCSSPSRYVRSAEEREKLNHYMRTYRYGVTPERYEQLIQEQGNACAVCRVSFENARACIDHDHNCCPGKRSCGKCVRGLLCTICNTAAGYIETKFDFMEDMFKYLRTHLEMRYAKSDSQGGER